MKHQYKDQCDCCNKFKYCKGYNNKVLCEECIKKIVNNNIIEIEVVEEENNQQVSIKDQTTIFDYI